MREQERITEFLKGKGWKLSEHPFNTFLISPDSEWSVEIEKNGYWYAGRFTDSDVETEWGLVAQGRYEKIEEGCDFAELRDYVFDRGICFVDLTDAIGDDGSDRACAG